MTPQLEAALGARRVMLLGLMKIEFPHHTLLLCDGAATVPWNGETYRGKDPLFGTIGEVTDLSEETGDGFPTLDVTLFPPSLSAAVDLCNPAMQGAPVRVWLAAVDVETGLPIPDPELLFAGEVDVPILEVDQGSRSVTLKIDSVFERLFDPDEGVRLADSFHQYVWPGELGFANMTGTAIERLWGPGDKPPSYTVVPQGAAAPGGGGGGGFDRGYGFEQELQR